MKQQLTLSNRVITYDLQRKKVKNINLRIKPDGSIYVSANNSVSLKKINAFILSKEQFIINALDKYEEAKKTAPKAKEYVSGEVFVVFGREIELVVISANKNYVECDGLCIYLCVKDESDTELKKKTLNKWLKNQCEVAVTKLCEKIYPSFEKYCVDFPQIKFRTMTSRWGSCHTKKNILTFNYRLISAPIEAIEGVVVHEFVHFIVPNHSKKFYDVLEAYLPDWKQRKKLLEQYGTKNTLN